MTSKYLQVVWTIRKIKNNMVSKESGCSDIFVEEGAEFNLIGLEQNAIIHIVSDDTIKVLIENRDEYLLKLNEPINMSFKDGYQILDDWIDKYFNYELKLISNQDLDKLDQYQIVDNVLFKVNSKLNKIIIPEGVTEIANRVFYKSSVREVILPSTLRKIGDDAFMNCESLKKIVIPDGVESLGSFSFAFSGLEEIIIPSSITEIGIYAFSGTKFLNKYDDKEFVVLGDGLLYSYNGKDVVVTIPEGVKTICSLSLYYKKFSNTSIQKVILPSTVVSVCEKAFYGLKKLKEVNICSDVDFDKNAFDKSHIKDKIIRFNNYGDINE